MDTNRTRIGSDSKVVTSEVSEVFNKIPTYLSQRAIKSMLVEVSCTPKPGCVDRNNNGAHKDMNFDTFLGSISAIAPYFLKIAQLGKEMGDFRELFVKVREIGLEAENDMFVFTGGINTHKGQIFALALLVFASSHILHNVKNVINMDDLSELIKEMTTEILTAELALIKSKKKELRTKGEEVYVRYRIKGARGMALDGYSEVYDKGVLFLRNLLMTGVPMRKALVNTFLNLLVNLDDTNILSRHSMLTLESVQGVAKQALNFGGILTKKGRTFIEDMDKFFINKNISPGGTADMLAVTYFLHSTLDWDEYKYEFL
jgi:triphosphoribosyl-dephospho-CoA synthase